ncbi:hypothetical protein IQ07DRAFT_281461 [Pyrenochaeta sp. DS3sAY3a]|nr:hypothetical protein IQ07DRAFT_281461 [Pyrenochaeta sp. DS3sAY3a]
MERPSNRYIACKLISYSEMFIALVSQKQSSSTQNNKQDQDKTPPNFPGNSITQTGRNKERWGKVGQKNLQQPCKFCKCLPEKLAARTLPPTQDKRDDRKRREKKAFRHTPTTQKATQKKTRIFMRSLGKMVLLKRNDVKFHMRQQKEEGQKEQDKMTMRRRKGRQSSTHAAHAESLSTICIQ